MKPFWVVAAIFAMTAFACSSVFAQQAPRPNPPIGAQTARELDSVTHGKKVKPLKGRKPRAQNQKRANPEDVGC
jgi:hypothetical protein